MTDITTNQIAPDKPLALSAGADINILANVTVSATGTAPTVSAVFSTASNVSVTVAGSVTGATGILLGDNSIADSGHVVNVRATGVVVGDNAMVINGTGMQVTNNGQVLGALTGMNLVAQGPGTMTVVNSGTIAGQSAGILVQGRDQAINIRNTGEILVLKDNERAIFVSGDFNGAVRLFNSGLIDGNIDLGSGNDRFDGSRGRVEGVIFGDAGNDLFILGTKAERIDGGVGIDTIAVGGRAGARIALDNDAANGGRAKGDVFANIENAAGSARGADVIRGSGADNLLDGRGGRDQLLGLAGDDTLVGGAGRDRLTGGSGDDEFQFGRASDGGDAIRDFRSVAGNNDSFRFDDAGFGGLALGALDNSQFRTRASSNAAVDADDRFIFRTSDATLWFDADGQGGSGPVLIADLQARAVVTADDILIF